MGDWIKHEGGKRPVRQTDVVQVKFRDHEAVIGGMTSDTGCAAGWSWWHDGNDDDIVAYRIIPDPEADLTPSQGEKL